MFDSPSMTVDNRGYYKKNERSKYTTVYTKEVIIPIFNNASKKLLPCLRVVEVVKWSMCINGSFFNHSTCFPYLAVSDPRYGGCHVSLMQLFDLNKLHKKYEVVESSVHFLLHKLYMCTISREIVKHCDILLHRVYTQGK